MRSVLFRKRDRSSRAAASTQAAPSGAAKMPSSLAMRTPASSMSSSLTAIAVPPLSRTAFSTRGDFLVLNAVRGSGGTAIAVSDEDMLEAGVRMASDEGIFAAPEGAACVDAAARLLRSHFLKSTERIVIYNTGSGLKYPEAYSTRFPRSTGGGQDEAGGPTAPQ